MLFILKLRFPLRQSLVDIPRLEGVELRHKVKLITFKLFKSSKQHVQFIEENINRPSFRINWPKIVNLATIFQPFPRAVVVHASPRCSTSKSSLHQWRFDRSAQSAGARKKRRSLTNTWATFFTIMSSFNTETSHNLPIHGGKIPVTSRRPVTVLRVRPVKKAFGDRLSIC